MIAVEDMVLATVVAQLLMVVVVVAMVPKVDMVSINQFIFLHGKFLLFI